MIDIGVSLVSYQVPGNHKQMILVSTNNDKFPLLNS